MLTGQGFHALMLRPSAPELPLRPPVPGEAWGGAGGGGRVGNTCVLPSRSSHWTVDM